MKILLGTTSPLKRKALDAAIEFLQKQNELIGECDVQSHEIDSGVPPTPRNLETYQGAHNRASALAKRHSGNADLYIGIESGLVDRYGIQFEECWCVVMDADGNEYVGVSSAYRLPKVVKDRLDNGMKHVDVLNKLGKEFSIDAKDTWAVYSKNVLSRQISMFEAYRNALTTLFIQH